MHRLAARAALVALLAAASGCATTAGQARARRLEAALDARPVTRPLDEVWGEARRFLAERGYGLAAEDAEAVGQEHTGLLQSALSRARATDTTPGGGRRLETGWAGDRSRFVAEATPAGGGFTVRLTRIREHLTQPLRDGERRRDPDLELALLRRLDPAAAAEVEGAASAPAAPVPRPAARPAAPTPASQPGP